MIATKERPAQRRLYPAPAIPSLTPGEAARERLRSRWGEPLLFASWMRVLMIHFEVDATRLQRDVPYELDLYDQRAFVTLVAFTMENMRPRGGGKLGAWLFKPIATHDFLNVRTYVRPNGEPGIHFLAEWLANWLAVQLGPRTFGLPYRYGFIHYEHAWDTSRIKGGVTDAATRLDFSYRADGKSGVPFAACPRGSLDEWLMERYAAFNSARGRKKFFRVWHPPWPQQPVSVSVLDDSLLKHYWPWFGDATLLGANYSPGLRDVWMGRPQRP